MTSLYPGQRSFRGGAVARETFKQDPQIQWFRLARQSWWACFSGTPPPMTLTVTPLEWLGGGCLDLSRRRVAGAAGGGEGGG